MPAWIQYLFWAAGVITALGIILGVPAIVWKKVIRPGADLVHQMDEMLPLMETLVKEFKQKPQMFSVLREIAAQFQTDSGSSLRDLANRLEETSKLNQENIEILKSGLEVLRIAYEATKQVSTLRDDKAQELALAIDRLSVKVETGTATGLRMEQKAIGIADDLAIAQKAVDGVKQDLADSHKRADETHHSAAPGAAADAAAQQTIKERHEAEAEDNSNEPAL